MRTKICSSDESRHLEKIQGERVIGGYAIVAIKSKVYHSGHFVDGRESGHLRPLIQPHVVEVALRRRMHAAHHHIYLLLRIYPPGVVRPRGGWWCCILPRLRGGVEHEVFGGVDEVEVAASGDEARPPQVVVGGGG